MQLNIPISNLPKSIDLVSLDPPSQPYPRIAGQGQRTKGQEEAKAGGSRSLPHVPTCPSRLYSPLFSVLWKGTVPMSHSPDKAQ
jgi:hypothetical protein